MNDAPGMTDLMVTPESIFIEQASIAQAPPRFWVCLHWAHPDGIEWTSTIINGEDQWEYLQEKYPGSYRGKCTREE